MKSRAAVRSMLMRFMVAAPPRGVLNETDARRCGAGLRRARAHERGRGKAGEAGRLAGQVRLVGVARVEREAGEVAAAALDRVYEAAEAQDPRERLRPVAGGRVEATPELALAEAEVASDGDDLLPRDPPGGDPHERIGLAARGGGEEPGD